MPIKTYSPAEWDRFWAKVDVSGDCWEWAAGKDGDGYGLVRSKGYPRRAHRVAYEILVGLIPPGLQLDHLCRNRACVNPDHLEPVTVAENLRRGVRLAIIAHKTHCQRGHEFTPENTLVGPNGRRRCRTCRNANYRAQYLRRKAREAQV